MQILGCGKLVILSKPLQLQYKHWQKSSPHISPASHMVQSEEITWIDLSVEETSLFCGKTIILLLILHLVILQMLLSKAT